MNPQTNINYNNLSSFKIMFLWDVSRGSNITLYNNGVSNYYPDPSGVLINTSYKSIHQLDI